MKVIQLLIASIVALCCISYPKRCFSVSYFDEVSQDNPIYYHPGSMSLPEDTGQDVLANPGVGDFTLEAIVSTNSSSVMVAAGKYGGSGNDYWLGANYGGSGHGVISVNGQLVSAGLVNDGQSHHVVGRREAGTLSLFVDGLWVGSAPSSGACSPYGNLFAGKFGITNNFYWNGQISDLAYYDNALSDARIQAHAAAIEVVTPAYTVVDTTDDNGEAIQVLVPSSYDPTIGAPVVIYFHGVGENQTGWTAGDGLRKAGIRDALIDAGYILASSNAAGSNWGNQAGMDANLALYSWLVRHYRIANQGTDVVFLSQSMGGLAGLNCLADKRFPCRGWYGIYPVCNLDSMQSGFGGQITAAYPNGTSGHDPVLKQAMDYPVVPFRFTASYQDTIVSRSSNTDQMKTLIESAMPESVVIECVGDHGDQSHFLPYDVVDFFGRCLQ